MKKTALFITSLLVLAMIQNSYASKSDLDSDLQHYVNVLSSGDYITHKKAMTRLEWAGFTSPVIFDLLANKLSEAKDSKDKQIIEAASWYAKTLAFSGNEKYRSLMTDVSQNAKSAKLRKYTKKSLPRLDKYVAWNKVISNGLLSAPNGRLEQQRIKNLISARDYELVRIGAKRIHAYYYTDADLIAAAVKRIESEMNISTEDDYRNDSIAWLIKGIARAANPNHKTLLENVAATHSSTKVRRYAKKALKSY